MKRITRGTAIKRFCFDCAGTANGTALCTILECDLWPFRIGGMEGQAYKDRIARLFEGKSIELQEAKRIGLSIKDFLLGG